MAGKAKGLVLAARKRFVIENFGEAALAQILASLPKEDQKILHGILVPSGWYPSDMNARFDAAIIKVVGGPSRQAFIALGRQSAEQNLSAYQANFVKGKTPMTFLEQTPTIYKLYYQVGRREFQRTGEKSGVMTTYDAEDVTEGDCLTIIGWHQRALEMVGAVNPQITHPACRARGGDICRYEIAWS